MPTYDYRCETTGQIYEVRHSISTDISNWAELCDIDGDCATGETCVPTDSGNLYRGQRTGDLQYLGALPGPYPGSYDKGSVIGGLDELPEDSKNMVFHAGTALVDGEIAANGGRVLNVTARGESLAEARDRAYAMVRRIDWPGGVNRSDIGWRAL